MAPPTRTIRRLWWLPVAALLLAGCVNTPSNTPEGYEDLTQRNVVGACVAAGEEAGRDDAAYCTCLYDSIVAEIPFDDFKDYEQDLRDDPDDVPEPYEEIAQDCRRRTAVGPAAPDAEES